MVTAQIVFHNLKARTRRRDNAGDAYTRRRKRSESPPKSVILCQALEAISATDNSQTQG